MAEITRRESWRQVRMLIEEAERAIANDQPREAIEWFEAVLAHPCAHHQVVDYEILDAIHQVWRQAGCYDDAIAAKRAAIAAGYRSVPDAQVDIAECLLAAGRREEADELFATLRERDPQDVWLYNAAASRYAGIDWPVSLRWALDGIEVAIATGDPDKVVQQLLEHAEAAWQAMDEPADAALVEAVAQFRAAWTPVPFRDRWGDVPPPEDHPCEHCGYRPRPRRDPFETQTGREQPHPSPEVTPELLAPLGAGLDPESGSVSSGPVLVAFAWFPAEQWQQAWQRWPHLLDELPSDHAAYSQAIEARIKRVARSAPGHRLHVVALTVDGLLADAASSAHDAGSAEARSGYAAKLLRSGEAVPWPPGRNQPCWCGSPRKYKKCCGPVPAAPEATLTRDPTSSRQPGQDR